MKNKFEILLLIVVFLFTGCKEDTVETLAIVDTVIVKEISPTNASVVCAISDAGSPTYSARGVCYATTSHPTTDDNSTTSTGMGMGEFTVILSNLTPGTVYYVRAYAKNSVGTAYGKEMQFSTPDGIVQLTTLAASSVTINSALSGGTISSDGGGSITARGVCWSTTENPTTSHSKTSNEVGMGSFTSNLIGLTPNTTYYVRAYAINSAGTYYGEQISFKTVSGIAELTTTAVSSISNTTAVSGGSITSDGGAAITARGVCWSISANPTTADLKTTNGTGTGSFTANLTGLTPSTIYYIRAYATNHIGTYYGEQISFNTASGVAELMTAAVSSITNAAAISGGNITSDGGAAITARGGMLEYIGESHNSGLKDNKRNRCGEFHGKPHRANTKYDLLHKGIRYK